MDSNIRREIILENYNNPYHKKIIDDKSYIKINKNSDSCIDNLDFYIKINDNKVVDAYFYGEACAVSTACASIICKIIENKKLDEVKVILKEYNNLINGKEYDKELIGELNVFDEIYKQEARKGCVMLPVLAVDEIINNSK